MVKWVTFRNAFFASLKNAQGETILYHVPGRKGLYSLMAIFINYRVLRKKPNQNSVIFENFGTGKFVSLCKKQ